MLKFGEMSIIMKKNMQEDEDPLNRMSCMGGPNRVINEVMKVTM